MIPGDAWCSWPAARWSRRRWCSGSLVFAFGARLDAPTIALAAAAATLVYALGQLYAMVWALSRPERMAQVGQAAGSFTQGELRDEKRRLLRAIKELEFDHGMGKLSTGDFETVIATYRLRAIEVMRALEGGATLHPELATLLAEREKSRELELRQRLCRATPRRGEGRIPHVAPAAGDARPARSRPPSCAAFAGAATTPTRASASTAERR
jgi:hypothetical protein